MIFPRKLYFVGECLTSAKMRPRGHQEIEPRELSMRKWGIDYEKDHWRASRLSFHLNVRQIPRRPPNSKEGLVLHTCDNEWCVNPKHLYLGTCKQNTKDKFDRHPRIHDIYSEASKNSWKNRSKEKREKSIANLYGQKGRSSYVRTEESRKRSAEARRRNWENLTPEQYSERCRNISKGKRNG